MLHIPAGEEHGVMKTRRGIVYRDPPNKTSKRQCVIFVTGMHPCTRKLRLGLIIRDLFLSEILIR